jgi:uncharacterized protein (TIGR02001 family)
MMNCFENSTLRRKIIIMKLRQVFVGALAVVVGLAYGASVQAQSSFSASVKLTSNYVFNGLTQTDNLPALQGSFDWSHSTGAFAGVWASNVASATGEGVGGIEIDYYSGYSMKLTDKLGVTFTALYYHYPNGDSVKPDSGWESYADTKAAVSYDAGFASFGATYNHGFGTAYDDGIVLSASVPLPMDQLPLPVTLLGKGGYKAFKGGTSYTWYHLGVGTKVKGFGIDLFYTEGRNYNNRSDTDSIVFGSISRSF